MEMFSSLKISASVPLMSSLWSASSWHSCPVSFTAVSNQWGCLILHHKLPQLSELEWKESLLEDWMAIVCSARSLFNYFCLACSFKGQPCFCEPGLVLPHMLAGSSRQVWILLPWQVRAELTVAAHVAQTINSVFEQRNQVCIAYQRQRWWTKSNQHIQRHTVQLCLPFGINV